MFRQREATASKYKLMIVGKTGAGKSSFGNFVLGRELFEASSGMEMVTAKAAADSVMVEGYELYLVDTPGFGDPATTVDDDDIGMEEMVRGLQLATEDGDPGIDMIVYVVSASDRFTREQHTAIEAIKGSEFWSYVLVVFTHADRVPNPDKRQYIQSLLHGAKCPEALKLMMKEVDQRFMIVNTLDTSEAYRREHVYVLLCNLHHMKEKNKGKRYSHQLFVDIHEKYKELRTQSKEQRETMTILLQRTDEMRESYTEEIERLEVKIIDLEQQVREARKHGQSVAALQCQIANLEEERRRKQNEEEEKVRHLEMKLEKSKANFNEEAAKKEALQRNVERLKQELAAKKCDRAHCQLL